MKPGCPKCRGRLGIAENDNKVVLICRACGRMFKTRQWVPVPGKEIETAGEEDDEQRCDLLP